MTCAACRYWSSGVCRILAGIDRPTHTHLGDVRDWHRRAAVGSDGKPRRKSGACPGFKPS